MTEKDKAYFAWQDRAWAPPGDAGQMPHAYDAFSAGWRAAKRDRPPQSAAKKRNKR